MSPDFTQFREAVKRGKPRAAVVLGSGLGETGSIFRERVAVPFSAIPGLLPSSVGGHAGRLALGEWAGAPALVFFGRLHFYEGHPWRTVTASIRLAAELGARTLILTNAAGGIHHSLAPGALLAIRGHLPILDRDAWKNREVRTPYSQRLLEISQGCQLGAGIYAALTGPVYETAAEIRALAAMGADAVGMSTAKEAEAAGECGLEVAAISCITNRAAGLAEGPLAHTDVLNNARMALPRLMQVIATVIRES